MTSASPQSPQKNRTVQIVPWWVYPALFPVTVMLRLWLMTLRFHVDPEELKICQAEKRGRMMLFWHNRILISAELHRRFSKPRKMNGLVSASKDGSWLTAFFELMGVGAIRGSSSWRGGRALLELSRVLDAGEDIGITPDGPRGPCYSMKSGPAILAKEARCPVFLVSSRYYKARRLASWDGFYLPMPFSRVDFMIKKVSDAVDFSTLSVEEISEQFRQGLMAMTDDGNFSWKQKSRKKNPKSE